MKLFYLGIKPLVHDIIRHHRVLEERGLRLALILYPTAKKEVGTFIPVFDSIR